VKLFPRLHESDWAAVRTVDVAHSLAKGETFVSDELVARTFTVYSYAVLVALLGEGTVEQRRDAQLQGFWLTWRPGAAA
jgi:hypothetical protein